MEPALREGILLFNHGKFFECHEVLEAKWRRTTGRPKDFYPAIAPRPLAVGGTVVQQLMGGRDVAPLGADVRVPRAMPVGLHNGLIQAAVAFHHWAQGNQAGAMSFYRSSSAYLRRYRPEFLGVDVEQFLIQYMELFGWLRRHRLRYDFRLVPPIRLAHPV